MTNDSARSENGMPVSPAITDGSHAPLGVAENPLPQWSTTSTHVVSCAFEGPDPPVAGADAPRFPGRLSIDACAGSISLRRSVAYDFDSSVSSGILLNF